MLSIDCNSISRGSNNERATTGKETEQDSDKSMEKVKSSPCSSLQEKQTAELTSSISKTKNRTDLNYLDFVNNPAAHDVLLGRGKPFQTHYGNQSMLNIVDNYRERYHKSERAFKHDIIEEVLDIIKARGGRFLERSNSIAKSVWSQVPHRMAYRKVGHAFRSKARQISMERRDQANTQRGNILATASALVRNKSLSVVGNVHGSILNEGMAQAMPIQKMMATKMLPITGRLVGLAVGMGIGGHISGGTGLNIAQRILSTQEHLFYSNRIHHILNNRNQNGLSYNHSTYPHHAADLNGSQNPMQSSLQLNEICRRLKSVENRGVL